MERVAEQKPTVFVDRRQPDFQDRSKGTDRRQFSDANSSANPDALELAEAIDQYKLRHRRRFITFDELYDVLVTLGYHK